MTKLLTVDESIRINAPADAVWTLIGEFHHCWIDHIVVTPLDSTTRRMSTPDGGSVTERLIAHSDADRTLSYKLIDGDLPINNYCSSLSVRNCESSGNSLVRWQGSFEAANIEDKKAKQIIVELYQMGLQALAAKAENSLGDWQS